MNASSSATPYPSSSSYYSYTISNGLPVLNIHACPDCRNHYRRAATGGTGSRNKQPLQFDKESSLPSSAFSCHPQEEIENQGHLQIHPAPIPAAIDESAKWQPGSSSCDCQHCRTTSQLYHSINTSMRAVMGSCNTTGIS